VSLIGEAAFQCDLGEWQPAVHQQILGFGDPSAEEPSVRSFADGIGERSNKMGRGQPTQPSEFGDMQWFWKVVEHEALCDADLPGCKLGAMARPGPI
jgi:hypothetical protein